MKLHRSLRNLFKSNSSKSTRPAALRSAISAPLMEAVEGRQLFSTFVVTTNADDGTGSLRAAIKLANKSSDTDTIKFAIGSGIKTITTKTGLPYVNYPVIIDGTSQPGYSATTKAPMIELRGDVSGGYGLNIGAGNSTVKGLIINRYSSGILFTRGGNNLVTDCYIGTGTSGATDWGNKDKGIIVQSPDNTFTNNVISGNGTEGIQLYTYVATGNTLQGNKIGTDVTGTIAIANGHSGVAIFGAPNNLIGGTTAAARNIISGNTTDGVVINTKGGGGNVIEGNYIGVDATGTKRLGNLNYGVETSDPDTTVGGTTTASRNIISGNGYTGVVLWTAASYGNLVQNNYIGTDVTGTKDIGNYWRGVDVSNGSYDNMVRDNLISGNDIDGVLLYQGKDNTVQNNIIGWDATKKVALKNFGNGIRFTSVVSATAIGNYIGNNDGYGLFRTGGGTVTLSGNTLINDAIFNL